MRRGDDSASGAWTVELPAPERTLEDLEAKWSHDGSRILVSRLVDPRWSPLLDAARPDIGAGLVLTGVLAILIGAVRILRSPRVAGRTYCRRCNHDLNATPGQRPAADRCPECGSLLEGRGAVRASALGTRLLRLIVASMLVIGVGAALFAISTSVSPLHDRFGEDYPPWPSAAVASLPDWPLWRRSTIDRAAQPEKRIDVIRVGDDGVHLEGSTNLPRRAWWIARPDGAQVAWVSQDPPWARAPFAGTSRIGWADFCLNCAGSVDIDVLTFPPRICGWTSDGHSIVAHRWRADQQERLLDDGRCVDPIDVILIELDSGEIQIAGKASGYSSPSNAQGAWDVQPSFSAVRTGPHACVATIDAEDPNITDRSGLEMRTYFLTLTVDDAGGTRTFPLGRHPIDGYGYGQAWITDEDEIAVELMGSGSPYDNFGEERIVRLISLADGSVRDASTPESRGAQPITAPPRRARSPDGSKYGELKVERDVAGGMRIRIEVTPAAPSPESSRPTP